MTIVKESQKIFTFMACQSIGLRLLMIYPMYIGREKSTIIEPNKLTIPMSKRIFSSFI